MNKKKIVFEEFPKTDAESSKPVKTTTTATTTTIPANEVRRAGFSQFNTGDHLCVEVPDDHYTISCRLSDGRKITFAFVPYEKDGMPQCVDIHDAGGPIVSREGGVNHHAQKILCFNYGNTAFRADAEHPVYLTTLIFADHD